MILTDATIKKEMESGNIIITPFNSDNLGTNSIDLTLGDRLMVYKDKVLDTRLKNETIEFIIPDDGCYLSPNIVYLATTVEHTETRGFVPVIEGKSSLGRLGLFVHVTAGFGDDGFCGQWTLELVVTQPLKIYPNMKICQISYHKTTEPPLRSYAEKPDAKYNNQVGVTASKMHLNFNND